MNYRIILYIVGWVLNIEAAFMLLPILTGALYGEPDLWAFVVTGALCLAIGGALTFRKPKRQYFYVKEGYVTVSLCWVALSVMGALPFLISGSIPHPIDALFETVSGFTTTGASILTDVEAMTHGLLFWRSFTHWVGGMGVLVFLLAIVPLAGGRNVHIMRAESPGPVVGKLVPRVRDTALILYGIYIAMTLILIVLLLLGGCPFTTAPSTPSAPPGQGASASGGTASPTTTVLTLIWCFR